ncbi:MAG: ADP-glyceromanno-heptose 6-epimerase [Acetobacteraceae bacterium]|nr:ADP-glyceromanno-heptose 6-epimerase [Acetobacteraceae bacterium]
MIMLTGGAGFIGSNLHSALVAHGYETVIVDRLGSDQKWRNVAKHLPARLIAPEALEGFLATHPPLEAVFHLGAISDTAVTDADLVWAVNVETSLALWRWCAARGVRFIYTSSAATYGDGSVGFDDDASVAGLSRLRPLNLYGWTKKAFDVRVARMVSAGEPRPPQWAGLKFFNVYGPNEYHKGMISVVKAKYDDILAGHAPRLFRSERPDIADGGQQRDFTWVGDAVDVLQWLLDHPGVNGLFNAGTGQARSFLDMAHAVCDAAGVVREVDFIEMPESLREKYQSFTQATMTKLRAAGYEREFTSLEAGVLHYVRDYLTQPDPYR